MITKKDPAKITKKPAAKKKATVKAETKKAAHPVKKAEEAKPVVAKDSVVTEKVKTEDGRYFYAIGRRKTAMAKVRGFLGAKDFVVNTRPVNRYFATKDLQRIIFSPLTTLGLEEKLGWKVNVAGGGIHSQAEAVRHGIAQALVERNPEDRVTLKRAGFLTRDPRVKERKKPGLKKARRAPQWSKR